MKRNFSVELFMASIPLQHVSAVKAALKGNKQHIPSHYMLSRDTRLTFFHHKHEDRL